MMLRAELDRCEGAPGAGAVSRVSIVICTYNRAAQLQDGLQAIESQDTRGIPAIEVVIVDNNSADETRAVVEAYSRRSRFAVKYVPEPRQGIGYARNAGINAASGDVILYIDDDAQADPDWARAMVRCFMETDADIVGGSIIPVWVVARPSWLSDEHLGPVIASNKTGGRSHCAPGTTFLTANMGVRRASVSRFGAFNVSLGVRGSLRRGGEDVDLCRRWGSSGASLYYESAARVRHPVDAQRVSESFYRSWYEGIGFTEGHRAPWKWHHRLTIMPLWQWWKLAKAYSVLTSRVLLTRDRDKRFQGELWYRYQRSYLEERFAHWLHRGSCPFLED